MWVAVTLCNFDMVLHCFHAQKLSKIMLFFAGIARKKKGKKLFILRSWRTTWIPNFQGERNATVFRLALFFFAFQQQGNTVKRQRQYCIRGRRKRVRRSNMIQVYLPSFQAGFQNGVDPTRNTSPRLSEELIVKHRKKKKKSRILTFWLSWHCVRGRRLTICVVESQSKICWVECEKAHIINLRADKWNKNIFFWHDDISPQAFRIREKKTCVLCLCPLYHRRLGFFLNHGHVPKKHHEQYSVWPFNSASFFVKSPLRTNRAKREPTVTRLCK